MIKIEFITAEAALTRQLRDKEIIRFPQLTIPLLAALTPSTFEVHHTDEIISPVDYRCAADLVAITCNTPAALHAYEIADTFRAQGTPVVIGGPHPTLLPNEAAMHADAVVIGEAEDTWPQLLRDYASGDLKQFYKSPTPPCLRGLPHARRDLLQGRWYSKGVLIATRGCPHSCEYCSLPHIYHRQTRFRPVEEVAQEVAALPGKPVVFWDDNIASNHQYAKDLFKAIKPFNKWWTSQATIEVAEDEELLRLAAESGCKALFIGLESFSQESLNSTSKGFNRVERYKDLIRRLHHYGIAIQAGIVFGFDGDQKDIFQQTVAIADEIAIDNATISLLVPFPGTKLYSRLEQEGRILTRDWSRYNGKTEVVFLPRLMSPDELFAGFEWARHQFYSWRSIWTRLSASRTGLEWNLPRNVGYHRAIYTHGAPGYNPASNLEAALEIVARNQT